ncbi:MAG: alpha/beta hydrolase, partial [Mesorhizobium sp.]|nr:alpha/beta hydrolase [Mesorhizobium sp.]
MSPVRHLPVSTIALAAIVALTGCAGHRADNLFSAEPALSDAGIARTHGIYIATTREPSPDARRVFDGKRARTPTFARIDMSVPAIHKVGAIERPVGERADPSKYFTARSITPIPGVNAFARTVAADARPDGGRALVFVHGYNTDFDDAVYRLTQISHDSGYTGAPILFSWASGGKTIDYVYDRDSANAARDALEQLLDELARSGLKRIDIVAHSMGTWLTMEALRGLAIGGNRDVDGRLGDVVLASPDIDVDVFKTQMKRYGKPDRPFIVLLSDDDQALRFSSMIAGKQPRLGDYRNAADIAALGVIVADLTAVKAGDSLNHTKFADNPALVKLLGDKLREGDNLTADPDDGAGLLA